MTDQHYFQSSLQQSGTAIDEFATVFRYTDVIFVSSGGNNTDGSTWSNAYTSISTALSACGTTSTDMILLNIGVGTYDVNVTGNPTYAINVHICGSGRELTIIKNDHASATAVIKLTRRAYVSNLTIDQGTVEDGIIIDGTSAHGSKIYRVTFDATSLGGAADSIQLTGGVKYLQIIDVHVHGHVTHATAIRTENSLDNDFKDLTFHNCLVGIHLDHTNDHDNHFRDLEIHGCAKGLLIDTGADNNIFKSLSFYNNTANSDDSGTGTFYQDIKLDIAEPQFYPITAGAGVQLTSGTANTWDTNVATIIAGSAIGGPFKIIGIIIDTLSAVGDMFFIRIGPGTNGQASLDSVSVAAAIHGAAASPPAPVKVESRWIADTQEIAGEIQSESGADTLDIWVIVTPMG